MNAYRRMLARTVSAVILAGAFMVVSAARADAALIVVVCNDAACSAGGTFVDLTITDNSADDTNPTVGRISTDIAGGTVDVDASSYPSAGSPSQPFLALTYDLDEDGFDALDGTPYFFAYQDGFTATGIATIEANASSGGGTAKVYANFSEIFSCTLDCLDTVAILNQPYSLVLEVAPTPGTLGTARGDVTMSVAVPDGGTTATLLGSALMLVGMLRRRYGNG